MLAFDRAGQAVEQSNCAAFLASDGDAIGAGTPCARGFCCRCNQHFPQLRGLHVGDLVLLRDGQLIVGVAGKGKSAVGQRKDVATVTNGMPVQHVGADCHLQRCTPRRDLRDAHAKPTARRIFGNHQRRTFFGTGLWGQGVRSR